MDLTYLSPLGLQDDRDFKMLESSLVQITNAQRENLEKDTKRDERKKRWANVRPTTAQIYVENRCNLKCQHCYESETSHPPERYALSVDDYSRIFDELAELGVLYVTFTGGEVFLRRDFLEIVSIARKKRFDVSIFTSGTLIDEKKSARLAQLKVQRVEITVYSHDSAVHDAFTGVTGSHSRSVRALQLLNHAGVKTVMKSNLMTFNVEHVDGLVSLAEAVGADYQFDPTVKPRMDGDRKPLEYAVSPDKIRQLVLNRPDLYTAFQKFNPDELCSGEKNFLSPDSVICGAARGFISVSADGGVYACGFFPVPGGHIRESSLKDIWYGSEQFSRIRETTFGKMTACSSCDVKSTCVPCMAYAEVEHRDHTQCASSSRQMAEAVRALADRKVVVNHKLSRGKSLPIVGELEVPRPSYKSGLPALSLE